MGSLSIWHWLIVIVVVALLFGGRGKISELMGDVAKGVKSFKKGLADDDERAEGRSSSKADPEEKTKVELTAPAASAGQPSPPRRPLQSVGDSCSTSAGPNCS